MLSIYLDKCCVLLYHVRTSYVASFMLLSHSAEKALQPLAIMTIFENCVVMKA